MGTPPTAPNLDALFAQLQQAQADYDHRQKVAAAAAQILADAQATSVARTSDLNAATVTLQQAVSNLLAALSAQYGLSSQLIAQLAQAQATLPQPPQTT